MISTYRNVGNVAIIVVLLLYLQTTSLEAGISTKIRCPIGFEVAYSKGDPVCFQKKGPETFGDKFKNCAGNRYTFELLKSLNITPLDQPIWTDYKNLYDGGPFVDWSYTKNAGDLLDATYEVNTDSLDYFKDELCVVEDPVFNFTAVRCNQKHYRYCLVDIYKTPDFSEHISNDGCGTFNNSEPDADSDVYLDYDAIEARKIESSTFRFLSPLSTCMLKVVPKHGTKVRMTWSLSQQACNKKGGSLLNRGWIYSNYPIFSSSNTKDSLSYPHYPFGVILSANLSLLRYDADHDNALIPQSEWHFDKAILNDTRLGAVLDDSWDFVNSSYIFYDVICEKTVPLRYVNMTVFIEQDFIVLTLNDTGLNKDDIHCFTDSSTYYPKSVKVYTRTDGKPGYFLKSVKNGYYWCIHSDSRNFIISESNKELYINVKEDISNLYAVKLTSLAHDYNFTNIAKYKKIWKKKIEEYVFYSTKYSISHGVSDVDNRTISKFRNDSPGMDVKNADVSIKRVYLNSRSSLLHVKLYSNMLPVKPGEWDDIRVDYMYPAYFCELEDSLTKRLELGETFRVSECKIYTCTGNFNEGVRLIITAEKTCYTPTPADISSAITVADYITTTAMGDITDVIPTAPPVIKTTESTTRHQYREASSDSSEEDDKRPSTSTGPPNTDTAETPELTESPLSYGTVEIWPPTHSPRPPTLSTFPTPVITAEPTLPTTPEFTTTLRPIPPADQLQQVLDDLDLLLNNSTQPVMVADIENTFDQMDVFLADTEDLEIPGNLLHLLDELGGRIDLNGSNDASAIRGNIALVVADANPATPVRGLKIAARDLDMFEDKAFEIIREDINSTHLMTDKNEVVIQLPESVTTDSRRISFVVFRNDRAFQSSHGLYSVNSRVLSVNIENTTQFHDGEVIDIYLTPLTNDPGRNQSRSCAFWKFLDNGFGAGHWSQDGCTFVRATSDGMLDSCRCDHLTHFAEVLIPRTVFSEKNENALEILSIIGCCLSIFGIIWVGVTALMFRSWRRDYSNKIWLQLCISIFILSLSFLIILFAHFEEYDVLCMITGIFLHFSVLSSFCWMLVAAVLSYRRLVTVFTIDASHKLLRASAFAWGTPCAVVGILLSVAPHSYSGRFDVKTPTAAFCYPSGLALWLSVYAPIAIMLLANWTLFALIVRSVLASRRNHPNRQVGNRNSGERHEALRCASVSFFLVFLFGLPWIFGLFSMNVVMAYFFVLLSTFQGFVLFLFFVFGNKKTRDLWLNKLKIKQTRKIPVTSSTYTNNRSTGVNVHSRNGYGETIEAKVSRPKSLTSSDNSRFS